MKTELYNYDIYPKVMLAGKSTEITIKPMGFHAGFTAGQRYTLTISAAEQGASYHYPDWASLITLELTPESDGCLRFTYDFPTEQRYIVTLTAGKSERETRIQLDLYALAADMAGRIPLRGDLHMHTCRSDGREAPEVVCANYRGHGYDFLAVTDHRRYYPSLEVMNFFRKAHTSYCLVPGEEVHLPLTDVHIVNFGGLYSVNALWEGNTNQAERGDDPAFRSLKGECPPVLSMEEYTAQIEAMAKDVSLPTESLRKGYAVCLWAYDRIREAQGLAIFAHPYWRQAHGYQIPEVLLDLMLKEHRFDAFEVLGGENYFEHNGFQAIRYYEEKAKGNVFPIVGSTDSHGSTEHNRNARICSTIVFAPTNEREALISAIKEGFSVAVDTISSEYRLVGDLRLVKYASFLMEHYYPLHDRLCAAEGMYLYQYAAGDESALEKLRAIGDDIPAMWRKYFAV